MSRLDKVMSGNGNAGRDSKNDISTRPPEVIASRKSNAVSSDFKEYKSMRLGSTTTYKN